MKNPKKGMVGKSVRYVYNFLFNKACIGPYLLMLTIFNRCDMRCLFCVAHSPILKEKLKQENFMMNFRLFRKIIDEASKFGVSLVELCGNGEPFMHKDITNMIRYIKKRGMACEVMTNGIMLNKHLTEQILSMAYGSRLSVSVDAGTEQIYNLVHNPSCKNAFKKIKSNLLMFSKQRKETKSNVGLMLTYVIFRDNYNDIINGVKFAKEVGADELFFRELSIYPGLEQLQLKKSQHKSCLRMLKKARELAKILNVNTNLDYVLQHSLFAQNSINKKNVPCYLGWFYMRIQANGNVLTCCNGLRPYSNIKSKTLSEIYKSKAYNHFRDSWNDKSARMKMGYSCDSCSFKMRNLKLNKSLRIIKPLKYVIEKFV